MTPLRLPFFAFASYLALAAIFTGCAASPQDEAPDARLAATIPVPVLARVSNDCPCCAERGVWLLRNEADKKAHYSCGLKNSRFHDIDWSHEWVVFATTGERDSFGHWIKIESVRREGARLVAEITENTPRPEEAFEKRAVRPFCVVKIPAQPGVTGVDEHRVMRTGGILLP